MAQQYLDNGELVPDDLITNVVLSRIAESDCKTRGWLLDGFPRTVGQANALLTFKNGSVVPDCVLELEVPDEEVIRRIAGRRVDLITGKTYHMEFDPPPTEIVSRMKQRSDDTEEKIRTRLIQFHSHVNAVRSTFESYCNATIHIMRASGNQTPAIIARTFADFVLHHIAQRSLHLIRLDISKRIRRRVESGERRILWTSPRNPSYPNRANVRAFYASRCISEQDQQIQPLRRTMRDLFRRLRLVS
ncbi:adenylate [Plasmopara halstedii]|uniref:Adenylate n=1 Tax=Plasmopara halstedii TaxID=4781 RepID=A0A0P1AK71_PLAHL|nr:adenylate [Plasmopara halstedii]CEG41264.1 adenylate [Plasmopara halstedii]|eukprot:XP_024577633.1 adenylate [Plasmopara halstedii]